MKQARQRASRRFLNDGARSALPQYLHTNFSVLRGSAFLVFGSVFFFARTGISALEALAPPPCLTGAAVVSFAFVLNWDLLLGQGLHAPAVPTTHCSVAATWEVGPTV